MDAAFMDTALIDGVEYARLVESEQLIDVKERLLVEEKVIFGRNLDRG
jgi:hypothetical protein